MYAIGTATKKLGVLQHPLHPPFLPPCPVYNTSKQTTTGNSPFFLMFGWKVLISFTYKSPNPDEEVPLPEYVRTLRHVLTEAYSELDNICKNIRKNYTIGKFMVNLTSPGH